MRLRLTFAIGDVHGCYDELRALLRLCSEAAGALEHDFVLLGDYVDRGPASAEVIAYLMEEQTADPSRLRCLRGNHDEMLRVAADPRRTGDELMLWLANGGGATLASYGVDDPADIPADHLAWIEGLPFSLREHNRFFVHAGVRPGVPLAIQSSRDMMWIREPFLSSEAWHGALVVHGHTPTRDGVPDLYLNRVNVDTGACFGRPLTAAVFSTQETEPLYFLNSRGLRIGVED
jgi:serine/threonine protein phosphatase 1